jgi:putative transcriptional regulator
MGFMTDPSRFLSGQLLLALPGIGDQRFDRAVIALCSHNEDGALGIGIGRLLPRLKLHDVMKELDIDPGAAPNVAVHQGGPVEPGRGFVLHSLDWGGEGSVQVMDKWALTSTLGILRAIAAGKGPARWLVAMGYAGWSAGQLENEMTRHGWHYVDGKQEIIFATDVSDRWQNAYRSVGIDPALLVGVSGSA